MTTLVTKMPQYLGVISIRIDLSHMDAPDPANLFYGYTYALECYMLETPAKPLVRAERKNLKGRDNQQETFRVTRKGSSTTTRIPDPKSEDIVWSTAKSVVADRNDRSGLQSSCSLVTNRGILRSIGRRPINRSWLISGNCVRQLPPDLPSVLNA